MKRPLAALAMLGALSLAGCGTGEATLPDAGAAAQASPLPVQTRAAWRADIHATLEATATLEAESDAAVPARASGEIVEILVEEGEHVTAGQVLARIDGERLALELEQARANLEKTVREFERMQRLEARGLVSAAMVEGLEFERTALQAAYELMRLRYQYTEIRAPIAGVVSSRDLKVGTHVLEGSPAFRVTDTSTLVVHLKIPQNELARISAGAEAVVRIDAVPERRFSATIARLSPTIDVRNGTFHATAYLDNRDGALVPGMFGRFSIAWAKHEDALLVPRDAVIREDTETVVYVVEGGTASRRPVTLGIENGDEAEVLDGLEENEEVVVTGQSGLRDGSRVLAATDEIHTAG